MDQARSSVYDVFLSFSGDDRPRARELRDALDKARLRVFLDERDIRFAHSITRDIQDALRGSKTMLLYYSASFPDRSACQFELHHAYLSALRAGEVERRILVVNPEDPDTGHLMPLEMRAHKYWRTWSSRRGLAELVDQVQQAVRRVDTPFPGIDFTERATTRQTTAGEPTTVFVGRYRDRWEIHSALHRGEHPLVETVTSPPIAALTGMTGIGKSSLVRVYVHDFGFLYRGGVHKMTLTDAGGSADLARSTHTEQLIQLAQRAHGEDLADRSRPAVLAWWNRRLESAGGPVLWVVDDVSASLPQDVLRELIPQASGVHTLLIGQHEFPRGFAEPVRLRAMTPDDGNELFTRHGPAAPNEVDAVDEVVMRLGGHPYAILFAAAGARGREGLWQLPERVEHLTTDAAVLDLALKATRRAIAGLTGAKRTVLGLSAVCSMGPLPAVLIRDVLEVLAPADHKRTNTVLAEMDRAHLVDFVDDSWQVHQLVREAARQDITGGELDSIAAVAAYKLIALAENGMPGLIEHGVALLDRTGGSPTYSPKLNTLAAQHYDLRGEPALAAPFHEKLHELYPDDPSHLLRAAQTRQAAGHLDKALAHVERLVDTAPDDLTVLRAQCVHAAVLDDWGKHQEAEAIWARVVNHLMLSTVPLEEQIGVRTAHIRNRRAFGYFAEARSLAQNLVAEIDDPALLEALIPARLELAAIGMATDDRHGARAAAQQILDHYQRRGLPGHINAIEAATLLHEGQLEVFILEKFPDQQAWVTAEAELRDQLATARREFGPNNLRTFVIAVAHMGVLVGLGDPDRVLRECSRLPEELAAHLGDEHRLHLRAVFLLGQAFAQRGDYAQAADAYRRAAEGQKVSLGPGHPETLTTTYELGVSQWREGDRPAARAAFRTVMNGVVEKVGRRNDLYGKAVTAMTLSSFMSSSAFRAMEAFDRWWRKR